MWFSLFDSFWRQAPEFGGNLCDLFWSLRVFGENRHRCHRIATCNIMTQSSPALLDGGTDEHEIWWNILKWTTKFIMNSCVSPLWDAWKRPGQPDQRRSSPILVLVRRRAQHLHSWRLRVLSITDRSCPQPSHQCWRWHEMTLTTIFDRLGMFRVRNK